MVKHKLLYPELSYKLNGLFFDVHNTLGRFRNEKQYSDYFETLLKQNNISYIREYALEESFPGEGSRRCIVDFIINSLIIIDFKAKTLVTKEDYYQMRRYLVTANKELGIIVNFRQKSIKPRRVLNIEAYKRKHSEHSD